MVRLYAEFKEQCVAPFLETSPHVVLDEAEDCLRSKGNSQSLIKLYKSKHMISEALACIREYVKRAHFTPPLFQGSHLTPFDDE